MIGSCFSLSAWKRQYGEIDVTTLVTGGAGFVGANLCERLVADGEQVIALEIWSPGRREQPGGVGRQSRRFRWSIPI